jgi:hypothetical protein
MLFREYRGIGEADPGPRTHHHSLFSCGQQVQGEQGSVAQHAAEKGDAIHGGKGTAPGAVNGTRNSERKGRSTNRRIVILPKLDQFYEMIEQGMKQASGE